MRSILAVAGILASLAGGVLLSVFVAPGDFAQFAIHTLTVEVLLFGLPPLLWHARSKERFAGFRSHIRRPTSLELGFAMLLAVSATIVAAFLASLFMALLERVGLETRATGIPLPKANAWEWTLALLSIAVVTGVCEEILFRGTLLNWLRRHMPMQLAVCLSALIFAGCHGTLEAFPALFLVGWALGTLFGKTDNLLLCAVFHALYNAVVLLLSTLDIGIGLPVTLLCVFTFSLSMRMVYRMQT